MNQLHLNIALLIFAIITWGYSWVLMKMGLEYAEPLTFAAWRCGVGALILLIFVRIRSTPWPRLNKMPDYLMVGLFQTTIMFGFMLYGMKRVTAGKTAVLLYTMPLWTIILVHFYLKEKVSISRWTGVALGTVGIICILGWDTLVNQNIDIFIGELLIIAGAVSWAVANIWAKTRMSREDVYMISTLQMTFGAIGLAILAIPTEGIFNFELTALSIYILLFTAIVATAVDFTIWYYLIQNLDIGITTFSSMLVPVFGLIFDWAILGNKLDAGIIAGGFLILAGIYKVSRS